MSSEPQFVGAPRIPMKYVDGPSTRPVAADQRALGQLISDSKWVFEQKFDGTRGLVVISSNPHPGQPRVWWPGRNGRASLAHTAAIQHFPVLNPVLERILGGTQGEIVLDGEIVNDVEVPVGEPGACTFYLFDAPYMRFGGVEVIRPTDPFEQRRKALDAPDLHDLLSNTDVKVVRQARTAWEKRSLLELVEREGGEGVMAKHVNHRYLSGERAPATDAVKIKLVKTADVVVLDVNKPDPRHGSCTFGVYPTHPSPAPGRPLSIVPLGGCSLIGKPEVTPGTVIEVEYLYLTGDPGGPDPWSTAGSLYQPRMKRIRTDKLPAECTLDQFRTYSRRPV